MKYSTLVKEGRIKQGHFSQKQIQDCLNIAWRDLRIAETVIETCAEWSFNIAYNAMQQAGRAFMLSHGYRSVGIAHHTTVIRFLEIGLSAKYEELLILMDRMRRKRNHATYDMIDTISLNEAKEAYQNAKMFVDEINGLIQEKVI